MWFVVSKKQHQAVLDEWGKQEHRLCDELRAVEDKYDQQDKVLKSTEREKVLASLQEALRLVQEYQRALASLSAADPNIVQANALLEKWSLKGEPNATYLGFRQNSPALDPIFRPESIGTSDFAPNNQWEREEEYWGDEAYGSANVRIEMEAIDEGEEKEEGYTRARVRFVDLDVDASTPSGTLD
jgi:hypothetical protein